MSNAHMPQVQICNVQEISKKKKKNTEKFQIIQSHLKSTEDLSQRTKGDMSHMSPPVSYSLVFSTVDLVCR